MSLISDRAKQVVATLDDGVAKTAMPSPESLGVKVGDIFVSSWGYDQTNIDFYEVTGLTGASVRIRKIAKQAVEDVGFMQSKVMPIPGQFVGEEMLKRLQEFRDRPVLKIASYAYAYLWDGQPEHQTSYA